MILSQKNYLFSNLFKIAHINTLEVILMNFVKYSWIKILMLAVLVSEILLNPKIISEDISFYVFHIFRNNRVDIILG